MKVQIFVLLVFLASTLSLRRRSFLKKINRSKDLYRSSRGYANEVPPHSLPYHAMIYGDIDDDDDNWWSCEGKPCPVMCSGALVSPRLVLTKLICYTTLEKRLMVILGLHRFSDIYSDTNKPQIFTDNSRYVFTQTSYLVALIILSRRAEINEYVSPIPIALPDTPSHPGSELLISGWLEDELFLLPSEEDLPLQSTIVIERPKEECEIHGWNTRICYEPTESIMKRDDGSPVVHIESGLLVGVHANSYGGTFAGKKVSAIAKSVLEAIDKFSD